MGKVLAIALKELRTYLASFMAWALFAGMLGIWGLMCSAAASMPGEFPWGIMFLNLGFVFMLVSAALTMRLLADEQRTGSLELLLTSPVTDAQAVLGKYLGSLFVYLIALALSLDVPLLLGLFGDLDNGVIYAGYLGLILMGGACLAVGLFASSLTRSQLVAFLVALAVSLGFWIVSWPAPMLSGVAKTVVEFVGFTARMDDFTRGVVNTKDVVYFLSLIIFFLFLAVRALEAKRASA